MRTSLEIRGWIFLTVGQNNFGNKIPKTNLICFCSFFCCLVFHMVANGQKFARHSIFMYCCGWNGYDCKNVWWRSGKIKVRLISCFQDSWIYEIFVVLFIYKVDVFRLRSKMPIQLLDAAGLSQILFPTQDVERAY